MITQREISKLAFQLKMSDRVIEKDYVLTWILLGIAKSELYKHLVFKGGTALKKVYFPDYRYSEDLDFTLIEELDSEGLLFHLLQVLDDLSKDKGFLLDIQLERIEHHTDGITIYINFVGPLQAKLDSRDIKVDITLSEKILFPIESRSIYCKYSDTVERQIQVYSLEEILVEKLCAIIGRTEPRDVYDAGFLFEQDIDFFVLPSAFIEKARFKGIKSGRLMEVLERKKPALERMWKTRLANQVRDLPHLEEVLRNLQRNLKKYMD